MMRSRRATSVLLLGLLAAAPGWPGPARAGLAAPPSADALQANTDEQPRADLPTDLEEFRAVMLGFLHDMDDVLQRSLAHPALASRAASVADPNGLVQIPFGPDVYAVFENANADELSTLRDAVSQFPEVLNIPAALDAGLLQLPATDPMRSAVPACSDNYAEFANVVSIQGTNRALTLILDQYAIVYSILDSITEIVGGMTEDTPYVGKRPALPLIIVRGILGFVNKILGFTKEILSYEQQFSELCLASCLTDTGDVHGQPSDRWRFRGCDNRDNNCVDGIDDDAEDRFAPEVSFDAALIGQCFATPGAAQSAVGLAVKATDDCSDPSVSVSLGSASPATCEAPFSVTVSDQAGNSTQLAASYQKVLIDGMPPQVVTPTLAACYPSVASARAAFTGPGLTVTDCTAVDLGVEAVEKECVTDFELIATDHCGNETQVRDRARIDATPPTVDIERLLIPSVNGLSCFATEADAVAAVTEATHFSDRCTAPEDLMHQVTTSGPACDLLVTASATDECGNANSDSLLVRVDPVAPKVSCSVATSILYPATDQFVDIGFSYTATDTCEPNGPKVRVDVTSDESTSLAYSVIPGDDPYPDAQVAYFADGTVRAISLRAQRSQANTADGRVYRIRVTATDSCGLETYSDCFVTVPRSQPGPGSAINSGQGFDATKVN